MLEVCPSLTRPLLRAATCRPMMCERLQERWEVGRGNGYTAKRPRCRVAALGSKLADRLFLRVAIEDELQTLLNYVFRKALPSRNIWLSIPGAPSLVRGLRAGTWREPPARTQRLPSE